MPCRQFRLRSLFILTAIAAVGCWVCIWPLWRWRVIGRFEHPRDMINVTYADGRSVIYIRDKSGRLRLAMELPRDLAKQHNRPPTD